MAGFFAVQWMVGYLLDNYVGDDRFYLMTVYTGLRSGAGTQSNVSFILTGSKADTGVRQLSDGERVSVALVGVAGSKVRWREFECGIEWGWQQGPMKSG